jgi:hypothetical protein
MLLWHPELISVDVKYEFYKEESLSCLENSKYSISGPFYIKVTK